MGVKKFKISHQRNKCIGCGSCAIYAPKQWSLNKDDGKADLKDAKEKGEFMVAEVDIDYLQENKDAAKVCPVRIIKVDE